MAGRILMIESPAIPQRGTVTGLTAIAAQVPVLLAAGRQRLRCADRDLSLFALSSRATVEALKTFLLARPTARVQCLVDDPAWLERRAARLRELQRLLPHALELRIAATDDPVGGDRFVAIDTGWLLDACKADTTAAAVLTDGATRVRAALASFERRWHAAGHNLPSSQLGL